MAGKHCDISSEQRERDYQHAWYLEHQEEHKERSRQWKADHPDEVKAYREEYRKANAEQIREKDRLAKQAKRQADPEGFNAMKREQYNPEAAKRQYATWYAKHKEELLARRKAQREARKEQTLREQQKQEQFQKETYK